MGSAMAPRKPPHERFAAWMAERGLTDTQAGAMLGVSSQTARIWRLGTSTPSLTGALAIERATADWSQGPIRPEDWAAAQGAA